MATAKSNGWTRHGVLLGTILPVLLALFVLIIRDASPALAQQGAGGQLAIVFDASGSMWGKLPGGGAKFEEAHEALTQHMPPASTGIETGITVFGPGCSRTSIAQPAGVRSPEEALAPIRNLNPKGKGPITEGLERALGQLAPDRPASLLVVLDGPDNCSADPCAFARRLSQERPQVKINVIGLDIDTPPRSISCMSEATNGRFFPAANLAQLQAAAKGALTLALNDLRPTRTKRGRPAAPTADNAPPAPDVDAAGPPHLVLSAYLGKSETALARPVRWQIFEGGGMPDPQATAKVDVLETRFAVPLPAGPYFVRASLGRARFEGDVTVADKGPTPLKARFQAGRLDLAVTNPQGRDQAVRSIVTIRPFDGDKARATPSIISPYTRSEIVLPEGRYSVRAEVGDVSAEREIAVEAGGRAEVDITLPAGELIAHTDGAVATATRQNLIYIVSVDDPDAPSGRRVVSRSAAQQAVFRLPAGTYAIEARQGLAVARNRVALGAGRRIATTMRLDAARLTVNSEIPLGRDQKRRPVIFKLYERGTLEVVAQSSEEAPEFVVSPGSYRIVAEVGARNVRAAQDVDLSSGDDREVDLRIQAGEVKMRVADGEGRPLTGQFWEVVDQSGALVWRTQQSSPRGLLAPGRYSARCETRRGIVEGAFEVASGDSKTIELRVQ